MNLKQGSWVLFDFANSAYSLLIMSFVFPIFFKEVIASGGRGDFLWGLAISVSVVIGGLLAPLVGAIADGSGSKKRIFVGLSLIAILGTALLSLSTYVSVFMVLVLFILTNVSYELAVVLYDAFLLHVASVREVGRISGLGWGLGYLGGIVALVILQPLYGPGYAGNEFLYPLTFVGVALFFLVFALPAFFWLKEPTNHVRMSWTSGFSRVRKTLREIRKHKTIAWFLVGFYFLNDALVTLFAFIGIYAREVIGFAFSEIAVLLIVVQLVGFPSTFFFGWLSDKVGSRRILLASVVGWMIVVLLLVLAESKLVFYCAAALTGLVIGSSQSVARSWLARMVPKDRMCEFFGFNGFASKVSAASGPLVFGLVSFLAGSQRLAMLALLPFFAISLVIFSRIPE
jgi:MFS transporter, UMF1 family